MFNLKLKVENAAWDFGRDSTWKCSLGLFYTLYSIVQLTTCLTWLYDEAFGQKPNNN